MPPKGTKLSEEARKKIAESRVGKPSWNKGLHFSEESKQKMSEAKQGKKMSDEFRQKRSEIMQKRWKNPAFKEEMRQKHSGENNPNYGKEMSSEQRQKISEFAKSRTDGHMDKLRNMNIGRTASDETKRKMSEARTGMAFTDEHKRKLKEAHLTDENRKIHSNTQTQRWNNTDYKKKLCDIHKNRCAIPAERRKLVDLANKRWDTQRKSDLNAFWYGAIRYYEGPQYCEKWTDELKERVRAYFGYQCAECGTPQNGKKLHVHHVWYNKRLCCDSTPRSLVPLCSSCHSKTNTNREYWSTHFQEIIDAYYDGKCWFTKEEMLSYL